MSGLFKRPVLSTGDLSTFLIGIFSSHGPRVGISTASACPLDLCGYIAVGAASVSFPDLPTPVRVRSLTHCPSGISGTSTYTCWFQAEHNIS